MTESSVHRKIRENRDKSGIHAMMQIPNKYRTIEDRYYSVKLGNLKISGNTVMFNLPALKTCPGKGECAKYCYAEHKIQARYKTVQDSRERNYKYSKTHTFMADMIEILNRITTKYTHIKYVRLHESGDFYSKTYLTKWTVIAEAFPDITFYAFTKSAFIQDCELPDNMIMWYSHGGKFDKDYRSEENQAVVVQPGYRPPLGFKLCPTVGNPDKVCSRDCNYCTIRKKGRRVAFPLH
jgi:hypothetical protein